ncbi:PREDICTED: cyclin-A2-2 [Tarenaya hassleriana]|uniref:cyclin-A2-2 n=1 Tax=Tarenaya hassleriana TaxID=28532 RepID=UPI00053C6E02|nr:PREDICTED: cyclin-A2-2 [Tarenaya hassleriana]
MHSSSSRHQNADKENIHTSNVQETNVRITRSRAKALGSSIGALPPSKPSFKQEPKRIPRVSHKRIASDDNKPSTTAASGLQHKRRAVLKDVTNTSSENIYTDCLKGSNVKASKRGRKDPNEKAKGDADASMEILVDVDAEKMKLAEDLSKIRVAEPQDVSVPISKEGQVTLQDMTCRVRKSKEEDTQRSIDCFQVLDIDSNFKDPRCCSFYAPDIFHNVRVAELEQRPSTNYMEKVQRDINPSMRGILVDWLVEVTEEYKLVPDTLYLTVNLIDRFLSHNYIGKSRLQLLGVTCMLIASKYEEICAPRVEEFCFITDNTYTRLEVLNMEIQVLNYLHYQLSVPTTKTFLRRFVQAAQASYKVPRIELEFLANYLAELTLLEYNFLGSLPSLIAASAVFLARWTLDQSDYPWNPTLQHYTRYGAPELRRTVLAMEDLQLNTSSCPLNSIREKYRQQKFKSVATLTSQERVTSLFSR